MSDAAGTFRAAASDALAAREAEDVAAKSKVEGKAREAERRLYIRLTAAGLEILDELWPAGFNWKSELVWSDKLERARLDVGDSVALVSFNMFRQDIFAAIATFVSPFTGMPPSPASSPFLVIRRRCDCGERVWSIASTLVAVGAVLSANRPRHSVDGGGWCDSSQAMTTLPDEPPGASSVEPDPRLRKRAIKLVDDAGIPGNPPERLIMATRAIAYALLAESTPSLEAQNAISLEAQDAIYRHNARAMRDQTEGENL